MKIAFLGDIALIGQYDLTINPNALNRLRILKDELKNYDYVVANLESPFTCSNNTKVAKSMHLKTNPINFKTLKFLGIDAVTLSNNHIFDFGKKVLDDTIEILDKNNIEWYGVYGKTLYKNFDGLKLAFSGYCCLSTNPAGYTSNAKVFDLLTVDNLDYQLSKNNKEGYFSVFSLHWGREHSNYPNIEHIDLMKKLTKTYDFIVHGHHSHVVQPVIDLNNSNISFSLGNCIFDDMVSLDGKRMVKQNDDNKISFIYVINFTDKCKRTSSTIGIKDTESGIVLFDITDKIKHLNQAIYNLNNRSEYLNKRDNQYFNTLKEKFGHKDFNWVKSRLNLNIIVTRIKGYINLKRYNKIKKKFSGD
jgi:poly-gamma-glutamate synthesis protein (capsule biosynthesis protein)